MAARGARAAINEQNSGCWRALARRQRRIEPVFSKIAQDHADAVMRVTGPMLFNERARVGAAVTAHRLPGMCVIAEEVPYGYLMSYGQDFPDFFSPRGGLHRQNTKRREASRSSRRATDQIQAGSKS
jgi:putative tryptophan/tyrosine transport system substrate-binding protein